MYDVSFALCLLRICDVKGEIEMTNWVKFVGAVLISVGLAACYGTPPKEEPKVEAPAAPAAEAPAAPAAEAPAAAPAPAEPAP